MAKRTGRPTRFTKVVGDKICQEIRNGSTLRRICELEGMPHRSQVYRWLSMPSLKRFRDQYEVAVEDRTEAWAEEVVDIADDASNDYMEIIDKDGESFGYRTNGEVIQRSKLRVETRLRLMAKHKPKKYGDKLDITSGDKPLERTVAVFDMRTRQPRKADKPRGK